MRSLFSAIRWAVRHRAWSPYYLIRYWRYLVFRLRHREVVTEGFVFLGKRVEVDVRKGYGRLVIGAWAHIGDGNKLRAHEGTLRLGEKVVLGSENVINCYLDIEIGAATLVADWVYICDFDLVTDRLDIPIKDQGLVKSPVRIGPGSWLGTKVTVLRGTVAGPGSVFAAHTVARGAYPEYSVIAGLPGRVIKDRRVAYEKAAKTRAYLAEVQAAKEEGRAPKVDQSLLDEDEDGK
ncbi:MAG: acyltransferase [Nocardioidaceae bacterium]